MSQQILMQVKTLLGKLTDEELQQVTLLATALRTKASKDTELVDWYEALSRVLHEKIEWRVPPLKSLPYNTQTQLRKSYYALLDWLNQVFSPQLTKVELKWALHWCACLLAESMLERERPLCLSGMLNATQEIPWVVQQAFPGYIEGGAMRWIIKASVNKGEECD